MSEMTSGLVERGFTIEWSGTEQQQHDAAIKTCIQRRKRWRDEDLDKDGSCDECQMDMAAALETKASEATRAPLPAPPAKDTI